VHGGLSFCAIGGQLRGSGPRRDLPNGSSPLEMFLAGVLYL